MTIDTNILDSEIQTYQKSREQLMADSQGRFVLIKGDRIVADFESYDDALAEGYKQFGNDTSLVKEVRDEELVNFFSRDLDT